MKSSPSITQQNLQIYREKSAVRIGMGQIIDVD